ncbi:MAG: hypothetical protein Q4G59_00600 [Planctomycetia bacterium]|nr:hypothetical protein [Planctomycetia bacterium]
MKRSFCMVVIVAVTALFLGMRSVSALDYYVDNVRGNDANDGLSDAKPFKTIRKAVPLLKPGDKLYLTKNATPYYENLRFVNHSGTKEKPIEVDGRGAVLNGSPAIDPAKWHTEGNNRFSVPLDIPKFGQTRFFVLFDGKMVRMSSCGKGGVRLVFKAPADLAANEWTWIEAEKKLYISLPEGKTPSTAKIAFPEYTYESGVLLAGKSSWLTFRNLTTENFVNDGYNIHQECYNVKFYNIRALYNGDDGISAHENCTIEVDGFYAEGNATGICHVQECECIHRNVICKNAAGIELFFLNKKNVLENFTVESTAIRPCTVTRGELIMKNGKIIYRSGKKIFDNRAEKSTIENVTID